MAKIRLSFNCFCNSFIFDVIFFLFHLQLTHPKFDNLQEEIESFGNFCLDKEETSYADRPDVHTPAQNISSIKKSDSVSEIPWMRLGRISMFYIWA